MAGKIVRLLRDGGNNTGMQPFSLTPQEAFTTDDHSEIGHAFFEATNGKKSAGVWECAPSREEFSSYPGDEIMFILEGELILTDADGHAQTFTQGDTVFIANGTECIWEITEKLRKFYFVVES